MSARPTVFSDRLFSVVDAHCFACFTTKFEKLSFARQNLRRILPRFGVSNAQRIFDDAVARVN
jgi:hypothetical protein